MRRNFAALQLWFWLVLFAVCGCSSSLNRDIQQIIPEERYVTAYAMADTISRAAAIQYMDSLHHAHKANNPIDQWRYMRFHLDLARHFFEVDRALALTDSMLMFVDQNNRDGLLNRQLSLTLFYKGDIYNQIGLYDEAYDYYSRARLMNMETMSTCLSGEYDSRIGYMLYYKQQYEPAAESFRSAFEKMEGCGGIQYNIFVRQRLLSDTGLSLTRAGKHEEALKWFQLALDYLDQHGGVPGIDPRQFDNARAVIKGNMGLGVAAIGEPERAERLFRESISTNRRPGGENGHAQMVRLRLAELFLDSGRNREAGALLDSLTMVLPETAPLKSLTELWRLKTKYARQTGDLPGALHAQDRHYTMQDSLLTSQKTLYEHNADDVLIAMYKERQLNILQRQIDTRRYWLIVIGLISVLLGVLTGVSVYASRRYRKSAESLALLNEKNVRQRNELEVSMEQIRLSGAEKDRILRMVAHDLRNPVGAMISLVEFMAEGERTHEELEILRQMRYASAHANGLIEEILATASDTNPELIKKTVNMVDLVRDTVQLIRYKAEAKQQELLLDTTEETIWMQVDPEKISRALLNLIGNAIKFSPKNARIDVIVEDGRSHLRIHVNDEGIGIPDALKSEIFDPFSNAKRQGTDGERPFGLGLSITRQVTRAHGGEIHVESREGEGTRFTVFLPKQV